MTDNIQNGEGVEDVDLDMSWIDVAVFDREGDECAIGYSSGFKDYIHGLFLCDSVEEYHAPTEPGVYRWSGFKVGSWDEGDAMRLSGGTWTPYVLASLTREPATADVERVDFSQPLEVFHEDGRVEPARLCECGRKPPFPYALVEAHGQYWGCSEQGQINALGWTLRNRAAPSSEPAIAEGEGERIARIIDPEAFKPLAEELAEWTTWMAEQRERGFNNGPNKMDTSGTIKELAQMNYDSRESRRQNALRIADEILAQSSTPPASKGVEALADGPVRVQLSRKKGWRMPANTVPVARPGRWGNPHRANLFGNALAVRLFRRDMDAGGFGPIQDIRTKEHARAELRGKNLACWCPLDADCHADVLLDIANEDASHG